MTVHNRCINDCSGTISLFDFYVLYITQVWGTEDNKSDDDDDVIEFVPDSYKTPEAKALLQEADAIAGLGRSSSEVSSITSNFEV